MVIITTNDVLAAGAAATTRERLPTAASPHFSHHLTAEARDKPAITSLRLLTVLTVLYEYASLVEWGR